jgi:glutathione synthase
MQFLFVMDSVENVQIHLDSTFAMMMEAQRRGHEVLFTEVTNLYLERSVPYTAARSCALQEVQGDHVKLGPVQVVPLKNMDAVFMRTDPPFDMRYIFATYILEAAQPEALVVNNPQGLRDHNEKLYALAFDDFCPESVVSSRADVIRQFQQKLDAAIVVKPLDGNGGEAVFIIAPDDPNRNVILETITQHGKRHVMTQRYLTEITNGDKRILLVDGEFAGAVSRIPQGDDPRGNIHVGAKCVAATLTPREQEMVSVMGPRFRDDGHVFVGIDVIGDYLTEVNVTSPTGIHEINAFDECAVEALLIDAVERRINTR